ncbi:MAG: hypothetical protein IJV44_03635 [Prevotella sp.]|nr:hypothetical protein [Prevotella sp.]
MDDITNELAKLHVLTGAEFSRQVERIAKMTTDYNARLLASDIKAYFEENPSANEVLIFKGNKQLLVNRGFAKNVKFNRIFRKMYEK